MTGPVLARTRAALRDALEGVRAQGGRVALVPTMGALHEGHASLMRVARDHLAEHDALVVSIFVNPMQFGAGEDLDSYPRTFDADLDMCKAEGADVVFAPDVEEVYPGGEPQVTVEPGPLAAVLEGASRPGHFRGVLTVVAKLFGLVSPDLAVFGEKDYQQLVLIRRMAADLCMGVEIVGAPTVRDHDGLALSSRNHYLSETERTSALNLSFALHEAAAAGELGAAAALDAARAVLRQAGGVELDYLELASPDLGEPPEIGAARMLVAARVGTTRLIDNIAIHLGGAAETATTPDQQGSI